MPSLDQIFPYVLRWGQRATDSGVCAASAIILVVRLAARISSQSLTLPLSREYSTFLWTVVCLRRMAYWWRSRFSRLESQKCRLNVSVIFDFSHQYFLTPVLSWPSALGPAAHDVAKATVSHWYATIDL